jgi:hypothetical protein
MTARKNRQFQKQANYTHFPHDRLGRTASERPRVVARPDASCTRAQIGRIVNIRKPAVSDVNVVLLP